MACIAGSPSGEGYSLRCVWPCFSQNVCRGTTVHLRVVNMANELKLQQQPAGLTSSNLSTRQVSAPAAKPEPAPDGSRGWAYRKTERREPAPLSDSDRARFAQENDRTTAEALSRQVGLTTRAAVEGTVGALNRLFDATIGAGVNAAIDGFNSAATASVPRLPSTTNALHLSLNEVGLPQPENAVERVVQNVASVMATASSVGGAALAVNALTTSPMVASVSAQFAAAPLATTLSTATGAGSAGVVREAGGGTGAQLAAAVIGAAVPAGIAVAATRQAASAGSVRPTAAVIEATGVRLGNLKLPVGAQVKLSAPGNPYMAMEGSFVHMPVEVRADALVFAGYRDRGLTIQVYSAKGAALSRFVTNSETPVTVPITALPRGSTMTIDLTGLSGRAHNPIYDAKPSQDFAQYSFSTNSNLSVTQTEAGLVITGSK